MVGIQFTVVALKSRRQGVDGEGTEIHNDFKKGKELYDLRERKDP